jgi:hypothetical protein
LSWKRWTLQRLDRTGLINFFDLPHTLRRSTRTHRSWFLILLQLELKVHILMESIAFLFLNLFFVFEFEV